jgi:hypothetical protein
VGNSTPSAAAVQGTPEEPITTARKLAERQNRREGEKLQGKSSEKLAKFKERERDRVRARHPEASMIKEKDNARERTEEKYSEKHRDSERRPPRDSERVARPLPPRDRRVDDSDMSDAAGVQATSGHRRTRTEEGMLSASVCQNLHLHGRRF